MNELSTGAADPSRPGRADRADRAGRAGLRRALAGTAFEAYRAHHDFSRVPHFMRPPPLGVAVEALEHRRPLARLQAAAWLLDSPRLESAPAIRSAIERLTTDIPKSGENALDLDLLREELRKFPGTVETTERAKAEPIAQTRRQTGAPVGIEIDPVLAETRFAHAYLRLARSALGAQACKREDFRLLLSFDANTLVSTVRAEVTVNRPASDFYALADPLIWAQSGNLFWQKSELGQYADGRFAADSPQPNAGTISYADRDLLEVVDLSLNPLFPLRGDNVLKATHHQPEPSAAPGTPVTAMQVYLGLALSSDIGFSAQRGGVDVDQGYMRAYALPDGKTRLVAGKHARFNERYVYGTPVGWWMNALAPVMLGPWIGLMLYEGACPANA